MVDTYIRCSSRLFTNVTVVALAPLGPRSLHIGLGRALRLRFGLRLLCGSKLTDQLIRLSKHGCELIRNLRKIFLLRCGWLRGDRLRYPWRCDKAARPQSHPDMADSASAPRQAWRKRKHGSAPAPARVLRRWSAEDSLLDVGDRSTGVALRFPCFQAACRLRDCGALLLRLALQRFQTLRAAIVGDLLT